YEKLPYFFSDQYDLGMEYRGFAPEFDEVLFRGDRKTREFIAFWLTQGKVVAAMNANIWDQGEHIEALLRHDAAVDRGRLADPDVELSDLGS
ncbi:MAG TPA: oxidoreductase C-terminal domain-containing protein, partial [Acidimicrobiales bacterium]|nr:oxidoreductase C-terminal domain-containing protein [Acidimicrobiales bacterium]